MDKKLTKALREGHYIDNLEVESGEHYDQEFEASVERILVRLGEDPTRDGLRRTPQRVAKAMDFLTSGYTMTVEEVVKDALFEDECEEMVIVKDVEFYSLCEHHMLPFFGRAHVGYLPKKHIVGLSKIARVIDVFARRLQVQERLTTQIATGLMSVLSARGVGVVLEACHFCMVMRGVQKQNSHTVTSAMLGTFRQDPRTRAEFMELIRRSY
jgi:GTP cyclohydrolase I